MAIGFLVLILIIIGGFSALKLRGPALKRSLKIYAVGLILSLGGCLGSFAWLGGETSGSTNIANEINPFVFATSFGIGVLVLLINSLLNMSVVNKSKASTLESVDKEKEITEEIK